MPTTITQALRDIFKQKRVVFWYDREANLREEFEAAEVKGVEKIELSNNELGIKYRIEREFPDRKFLIYAAYPQPADADNWLLDLILAYTIFHSDQPGLFLQEMGLDPAYRPLVLEHLEFFKSKERRQRLVSLLTEEDTSRTIRIAMIATLVRTEPDMTSILLGLLEEGMVDPRDSFDQLIKYDLAPYFWAEIKKVFGYEVSPIESLESDNMPMPIHMMTDWFESLLLPSLTVKESIRLFFQRWKDSKTYRESFVAWSSGQSVALNGEKLISRLSLEEIGERDDFRLMDKVVIVHVLNGMLNNTMSSQEVRDVLNSRRTSFWREDWAAYYGVLSAANSLKEIISQLAFPLPQSESIGHLYIDRLHIVDRYYRKMILHFQQTGQDSVLGELIHAMESLYLDEFLIPLQRDWDAEIDRSEFWPPSGMQPQQHFVKRELISFTANRNKVLVIISDAFRYESAREFYDILIQEKGLKPAMSSMITGLPSVTKVGMAALLPHQELSLDLTRDKVYLDGKSTTSTSDRHKILQELLPGPSIAMKFAEFNGISAKAQIRELIKEQEVIYLYHNLIDQMGESHTTEEQVFEATEQVFSQLKKGIKKYMNNGGRHVIITSDHGYLYQHRSLDATDIVYGGKEADVNKKDHRYLLGDDIKDSEAIRVFTAGQVGYSDDWQVAIPRGINRFPAKGTKRYVHGGGSLQEVVVPVLSVAKLVGDDRKMVEVDILQQGQSITTNQLKISFFQRDPVSNTFLPRLMRAGFYDESGTLVSNRETLTFDFNEEESRLRERKVSFAFNEQVEKSRRKTVVLVLEEPVPNSAKSWREYKRIEYTFNVSILRDFDF